MVEIYVKGSRGHWRACFQIDNQTFYVCERSTKKEALWYCDCLKAAFDKLIPEVILHPELSKTDKRVWRPKK